MCTVFPTNKQNHPHAIHPKRNHPFHAQFPQTIPTIPRAIPPNDTNHPTRNLPKRSRRGGACVPARTSAPRRFHPKIHALCTGNERWMRPYGATRAGTQAPPLPISTKPCGVPLPIVHSIATPPYCTFDSFKPRGVPLPHRGYTFDSAGLASATQPTLGNSASEEATPLGVVLFLITHHYHTRQMISPHEN